MFLPLSLATLGDLPKNKVASGAGFYNLTRQLGSSIGIAIITTALAYREAVHRSVLVVHEGLGNPGTIRRLGALRGALVRASSDPAAVHRQALKMLDLGIDGQAMLLSFADVFRLRRDPPSPFRFPCCSCSGAERTRPPWRPPIEPSHRHDHRNQANPGNRGTPKRLGPAARIVIGIAIAAAVVWLAHFLFDFYFYQETDDAYVAGHVHQVSAQVDGTVAAVLVSDNQAVTAGEVLARLDPLEFQLAVEKNQAGASQAEAEEAQASAAAAQAGAQFAGAQARTVEAAAQVTQAKVQLDLAQLNRGRARQLFHDGGAVTQSDLDNAESSFNGAQGRHGGGRGQCPGRRGGGCLGQGGNGNPPKPRRSRPGPRRWPSGRRWPMRCAQARLREDRRAGRDGRMGNLQRRGRQPGSGRPGSFSRLVEPHLWIVANFKETQLARVRAGLPVEISIDALPGRQFHGTVESVAPASGAQFALLPPDNATGNFHQGRPEGAGQDRA